jgi:hypothetical protein
MAIVDYFLATQQVTIYSVEVGHGRRGNCKNG